MPMSQEDAAFYQRQARALMRAGQGLYEHYQESERRKSVFDVGGPWLPWEQLEPQIRAEWVGRALATVVAFGRAGGRVEPA